MNRLQQKKISGSFIIPSLIFFLTMLLAPFPASADETNCTPSNVAVFDARVHVKCVESVGGIQYFAVSNADSAKASRTLSVINSAIVTGRSLFIWYTPSDTSGTSFGCQAKDCRTIEGIGFWE